MSQPKTASLRAFKPSATFSAGEPTPGLLLLHPHGPPAPTPFVLPLREIATTVGRGPDVDLVIPSHAVSASHATLVRDGRGLRVDDLGSRNGTFVNGRRVDTAELGKNDSLRFGDALFKVVLDHVEEHVGYGPDGSRPGDTPEQTRARMEDGPVGGKALAAVEAKLDIAARSAITVLLRGETGTGKDVLAQALHERSGRRGPFVPVHCGSIPTQLIEAELFGTRRGAYTGATADRPGHFRTAHGGTLFLDEIGDMPLEAQTRLLRVLQDRVVTAVGESRGTPVDVRVVAATHRDIEAMARQGTFRQDLLQRLKDLVLEIPPLRERREDIPMLCRAFLGRLGRPDMRPGATFMGAVAEHTFPGNVRELEAILRRAVALAPPDLRELSLEQLPDELIAAMSGYGSRDFVWRGPERERTTEDLRESAPARGAPEPPIPARGAPEACPPRDLVVGLLKYYDGNLTAVARAFDRSRTWLTRVMAFHGIGRE